MRPVNKSSVLLFVLLLLLLSSCDNRPQSTTKHTLKATDSIVRALLVRHHIYPFYISLADSTKQDFICLYDANTTAEPDPARRWFFSDTAVHIYAALVHLEDTVLTITRSQQFISEEWTYCTVDSNIERVVVNSKPYLYLSYTTQFQGTAVTERNIGFVLIDLTAQVHHTLIFQGTPSWKCPDCLEGIFIHENELGGKHDILQFLKQKAALSKSIYHPGEKDEDLYSTINYEKKWEQDNNVSNHYANGNGTIRTPVRTTLYQTDLFALQQGSLFDSVANDRYIFKSYFCGSVIGFDKERSRYFPLLIESCNGMCSKNIILSGDELTIAYSADTFHIPLQQIIYDPKPGTD